MSYHPVGARTNIRKKKSSLPNCHWNSKSVGTNRKRKKQYETLEEAFAYIKKSGKVNYFTAY